MAQLAVLALATRTVRVGTLLLAAAAGCYACAVGAVFIELGTVMLPDGSVATAGPGPAWSVQPATV